MWGFWRVYYAAGAGSQTDVMKPLVELPDRVGRMKVGTTSDKLVGATVDWYGGKTFEITKDKTDWKANPAKVSVKDWVEMQLPPQGKPGHKNTEKEQTLAYDATVNDWAWDGAKALTEPETSYEWVNYKSTTPAKRQQILLIHEVERFLGRGYDRISAVECRSRRATAVRPGWNRSTDAMTAVIRPSRPSRARMGPGVSVRKGLRSSTSTFTRSRCPLR